MTFKLVYLNHLTGELGKLPDLGIANLGGVEGPTFYVDGKPLLFADGTATDGSPASTLTLQGAYNNSPGTIDLTAGKNLLFTALNAAIFTVNAATGVVTISNNLMVGSIDFNAFYALVSPHLAPTGIKHSADQISIDGPFSVVTGANVEEALASIDAVLDTVGASAVKTYEHIQNVAVQVWTVVHNKTSMRPTVTIYGTDDIQVLPDEVRILNSSTIQVSFNTPQAGRAIVLLF